MVDNYCGVLTEGSVEIPVEGPELNGLVVLSGFSPGSEHRTGTLSKFSDHVHSTDHGEEVGFTDGVAHCEHFSVVGFGSVLIGHEVCKIKG